MEEEEGREEGRKGELARRREKNERTKRKRDLP